MESESRSGVDLRAKMACSSSSIALFTVRSMRTRDALQSVSMFPPYQNVNSLSNGTQAQGQITCMNHDFRPDILNLLPLRDPLHLPPELPPITNSKLAISVDQGPQTLQCLETSADASLEGLFAVLAHRVK